MNSWLWWGLGGTALVVLAVVVGRLVLAIVVLD